MKVVPIAYDSFSVRSMATFVKTKHHQLLIDPGIAIAPKRYGLPPTKKEWLELENGRKRIINYLKNCDSIVITHYHFDHHPHYDDKEFNEFAYKDKVLFVKDNKKINLSQKKRFNIFYSIAKNLAKDIYFADGKDFDWIRFSKSVYHGPEKTRLGYVIMAIIEDKNKFMFCSDVQGPVVKETTQIIINENPDFLIIDGPPTYFLGYKFSYENLKKVKENLKRIIYKTDVKTIIYDHHLTRDLNFKAKIKELYDFSKEKGVKLITAAEFLKRKNLLLEANRKNLM